MENKYKKSLLIMGIGSLFVLLVSLTYAYFSPQQNGSSSEDVSVTSNTTDLLTFQISEDINFNVGQNDFQENATNISGETTATIIMTPNNKTGSGTMYYYLYLNLETNETVYSSTNTNHDPELMLQVFNGSNQLVTLTGLGTQKTIKGVTGYDITGYEGLITIFDNKAITGTNNNTAIDTWKIVVTLINLDVDQYDNTNKEIVGKIYLKKEEIDRCDIFVNDLECGLKSNYSSLASTTGTSNLLYHHDNSLTNGAGDGSYRYSGSNPNNYICFGSDLTQCPEANLYRIIGIVPVSVVTDETTTPVTTETQVLYKIIRKNYIANSSFDSSQYSASNNLSWNGVWNTDIKNTWVDSLNYGRLNNEFLVSLPSKWANIIAKVVWKVGGNSWGNIATRVGMNYVYQNEVINPVTTNTTDGKSEVINKVGLMYVSDYGYAAPQSAWSYNIYGTSPDYSSSEIKDYNWLFQGVNEWTITRCSDSQNGAFTIDSTGRILHNGINGGYNMRPVFYLDSSVVIDKNAHTGTSSDPYRISNI